MLFFEDLEVGKKRRYGRYEVTREEVLDFARKYDAQPFHLDDEAAAKTHFGKIAASGWHTCAMTMAMMVEDMAIAPRAMLGAFVALDDVYVEGLVHVSDLGNDYFHFDAAKHQLMGERTRKRFRLGDRLRVEVVRVDLDTSRIDFILS